MKLLQIPRSDRHAPSWFIAWALTCCMVSCHSDESPGSAFRAMAEQAQRGSWSAVYARMEPSARHELDVWLEMSIGLCAGISRNEEMKARCGEHKDKRGEALFLGAMGMHEYLEGRLLTLFDVNVEGEGRRHGQTALRAKRGSSTVFVPLIRGGGDRWLLSFGVNNAGPFYEEFGGDGGAP